MINNRGIVNICGVEIKYFSPQELATLLSDLMSKRAIATATVATPATHEGMEGLTVANVASVAVANRLFAEEWAAIRVWLAHINEPGNRGIVNCGIVNTI